MSHLRNLGAEIKRKRGFSSSGNERSPVEIRRCKKEYESDKI
jgi:hypothetical protein